MAEFSHIDPLTNFTHTFFGYGNLDASVWFIGMEEGSGETRDLNTNETT